MRKHANRRAGADKLTERTETLTRFRPSGGVSAGGHRMCPALWLKDRRHPYPSPRADAHTGVAPSPSAPGRVSKVDLGL